MATLLSREGIHLESTDDENFMDLGVSPKSILANDWNEIGSGRGSIRWIEWPTNEYLLPCLYCQCCLLW